MKINKILLSICCVFVVLIYLNGSLKKGFAEELWYYGIKGGINFSSIGENKFLQYTEDVLTTYGINAFSFNENKEYQVGGVGGIFFNYYPDKNVNFLSFQFDLFLNYMVLKDTLSLAIPSLNINGNYELTYKLIYGEFSPSVRINYFKHFYVTFGPFFGIKLDARKEIKINNAPLVIDYLTDIKDKNWGITVGVGIEWKFFLIEAKYNWGLENISKNPNLNIKTQSFYILTGFSFPLKRVFLLN